MAAVALNLLTLVIYVLLGSIVFMTLGKWIFRLFGGCIVLRLYFAGDRAVFTDSKGRCRTSPHESTRGSSKKYPLRMAVNSPGHRWTICSGTWRLADQRGLERQWRG